MRAASWQNGIARSDLAGPEAVGRQALARLAVPTRGRDAVDLTAAVSEWLVAIGAADGLVTLFLRHTSASLTIQENTDPDVLADLFGLLDRFAPADRDYRHAMEGSDDMPAHAKAVLTGVSLAVPVIGGLADLGTWQAIYLLEHRTRPHRREVTLHYLGR